MYSFEGDFRRKPQQNLAGASARTTDRNALILQTQQQRQKREEQRRRLNGATKLQAFFRSFLLRKHWKQHHREHFDSIFPKDENIDDDLLHNLLIRILFFYDEKSDCNRLISLSQLLLRHRLRVFQNQYYIVQIRRLLAFHLGLLKDLDELPIAVPLRMLEVFTSVELAEKSMNTEGAYNAIGKNFIYLIKRGYFTDLLALLCRRTPPLYGPSASAPTPAAGALLDLVRRPLLLVSLVHAPEYDTTTLIEFTSAYLCSAYPEPVELYLLPALAARGSFPFVPLVRCLVRAELAGPRLVNDSWLLHAVLALEPPGFAESLRSESARLAAHPTALEYLRLIARLTVNVCNKQITYEFEDSLYSKESTADREDDSDTETEPNPTSLREQMLLTRCIETLNEGDRLTMTVCTQLAEEDLTDEFLDAISEICHNLLLSHKLALQKYRLLYTLAFKPVFLRGLWRWLGGMTHAASFGGGHTPLLAALARGLGADAGVPGVHRVLAPLAVFCALFSLLIGTLHDTEFCRDVLDDEEKLIVPSSSSASSVRVHAFEFGELGPLCRTLRQVCLGLVELAYPEARGGPYRGAVPAPLRDLGNKGTPAWSHLFKVCTTLLRALYVRDGRLHFCGAHWTEAGHEHAALYPPRRGRRDAAADEGPPMTVKELRTLTILREIPFVVPFATRVLIFQGLLMKEKQEFWYEMANFNEGPMINISVRRSHLYEDAFDKLRPENEPNMKLKLRVALVNAAGADEAGVDGGGLFREFLSELLKSAFDPNRGLFRLTRDNMLYPNPGVHLLYDDYPLHYFFVGRMLGKALYENLLVELPLAEFFLDKLCSSRDPDVHALASLDPGLYRGLLMLKSHRREDVAELGLDFTIVSDELGEQRIDELKPNGANIPVTAENRIEYIHLVADYKLNRQIRAPCAALRRGLTSVVSGEWLRMFSCRELQLLISGAEVPIDLADLRAHTQYAGGFSDTHPTVQSFWSVVEGFTDAQRRQLLKFVTSCSRPPLLGFKDLQPPFCIQSAGAADRLPSSSTCMNLLKLPEFPSEKQLADKLLYAIQSGAGFELS